MSKPYYRQCVLERPHGEGHLSTTTWIPAEHAVLTKTLKLKNEEDGTWDDGWKVTLVSEEKVREDYLPDPHSAIKGHRKMTGDALPKEKR